jgi:hypothetical protein
MLKSYAYPLSWLAFSAMMAANVMANSIPINGLNTGQVSALYPNAFVPAGFTFSIWGVIYFWLGTFLVYSAKPLAKSSFQSISGLFILTCLLNGSWIFAWHYLMIELSLLIMILLLATLALITLHLGVGIPSGNSGQKWAIHAPFSIYFGWISIASLANATALFVDYDWIGFGLTEEIWAMILIFIGIVFGVIMIKWRRDIFYALVVIWALFGITSNRMAGGDLISEGIPLVGALGMAILWILIVFDFGKIRSVYFR